MFLAAVYIIIIVAVVFYRITKTERQQVQTETSKVSATAVPSVPVEELYAQYLAQESPEGYQDISLILLNPNSFESAGYTLEVEYDPAILQLVEVKPGNVWSESVVLQKDTNAPGKLVYSVGRQLTSEVSGGDILANVRFEIVDKSDSSTEVKLSRNSKSAGQNNIKIIVAEPLTFKLK